MYKFLLFVIIGILMYLFLNTSNNGFNVGSPGRQLGLIPIEPPNPDILLPGPLAERGDLVELTTDMDLHEGDETVHLTQLHANDRGIVQMYDIDTERADVIIFRPILVDRIDIAEATRRLTFAYALNHRLTEDSFLENIPIELFEMIIERLRQDREIGTFNIDIRDLRIIQHPLNILRNMLSRFCASNTRI